MTKELETVRAAKKEKDRLWMEYQALMPMPKSQNMDGMPKGGKGEDQNARTVDLMEEARGRYLRAMERYQVAEGVAREKMKVLPPWLYSLCLYYYLNAMEQKEVQEIMKISESTFKRYKGALRKFDGR